MRITNTQVYGLIESFIRSGYPMLIEIPEDTDESYNDFFPSVKRKVTYLDKECDNLCFDEGLYESRHFKRATNLGKAVSGSGHDCFLKGIIVQADIEAPCYWWPQFQRYHFVDIISSQSKMHMITKFNIEKQCTDKTWIGTIKLAEKAVQMYNKGLIDIDELLSNIPQGLELTAGITTNYLQLKTMYTQRKNHRLYMWNTVFREFVENLPYTRELGVVNE